MENTVNSGAGQEEVAGSFLESLANDAKAEVKTLIEIENRLMSVLNRFRGASPSEALADKKNEEPICFRDRVNKTCEEKRNITSRIFGQLNELDEYI